MIEISKIRIDGGTQPRGELYSSAIEEYADAYLSGAQLPPVTLFYDGDDYWLADGFHRVAAAKAAGKTEICEHITPGTRRDAILFAVSANAQHGLRRSNADKRRAVEMLLRDEEWSKWSSREIARRCAVGHDLVESIRSLYLAETPDGDTQTTRTVQRNGKTYEQNTANVGKNKSKSKANSKTTEKPHKKDETPPADQKPAEESPPEYTALDEAHDTIRGLQDALALANSGHLSEEDREQASNLIASLREENRILTLKLAAVTASRDQYQTENGELKKQIARQRREIDKLAGTRTA